MPSPRLTALAAAFDLAAYLEAKHNPNGDPRCTHCRDIIRPYNTNYDGLCARCAGAASFVLPSRRWAS